MAWKPMRSTTGPSCAKLNPSERNSFGTGNKTSLVRLETNFRIHGVVFTAVLLAVAAAGARRTVGLVCGEVLVLVVRFGTACLVPGDAIAFNGTKLDCRGGEAFGREEDVEGGPDHAVLANGMDGGAALPDEGRRRIAEGYRFEDAPFRAAAVIVFE